MSDYKFLMESRLSPEQYRVLNWMSQLAAEQGLNIYLVGGAVRDLTYGQQVVRDLDVTVEGNPQRIFRHLSSGGSAPPAETSSRLPISDSPHLAVEYQRYDGRLNSADLRFTNGVRAELAMCRQEVYPKPGQRPKAQPAMIFDDLKRRDFSVNAMAVSLHPNSRGLLLDPTNGAADIERRELRALHSRSFSEEPWRIYRLLRLGLRLGFKPEERTKIWLATALENRAWERLEPEQQGRELRAILQEENPARVIKLLAEQKLLAGLDAKLSSTRIPYERFARIRAAVRDVPGADPFLLNFHALTENLGRAHKIRLAKKVINESKAIHSVLRLEHEAKKLAKALGSSKASLPSQVYALLSPQPLPLLLFLRVSSPSAKIQNRIKNYFFKYTQTRARLPRAELQALGVKPGPAFEKILERVFVEQLDGIIKTHQQLVKRLRELAGIKEPPAKAAPAKARAAGHHKAGEPPAKPVAAKAHAAGHHKPGEPPAGPAAAKARAAGHHKPGEPPAGPAVPKEKTPGKLPPPEKKKSPKHR